MSIFSGKCDLCDHIAGQGGWHDRNGNPVKMGDGVGAYYSDEMKDFEVFKKKTGGVIHQYMRIVVTEWNQKLVAKKCLGFEFFEHKEQIPDKRRKEGYREKIYYTYKYYGKEYDSLKELNKKHVYITKDIHFDTLLDIIPYYPYIVSFCCSSDGKETVYISDRSFVEEEEESALEHGWERSLTDYYRKELQNHYREVVLRYFNPIGRECTELITFDSETLTGYVTHNVDSNFPIQWEFDGGPKSHWTSPKLVKDNIIQISKEDFETCIGKTAKVSYVKAKEKEEIFLQ